MDDPIDLTETPTGLAIVAGNGVLPRLLAEECQRVGRAYRVVLFARAKPLWAREHPVVRAEFEKPGALFDALKESGCREISFAGSMTRPRLNPLQFDLKFIRLAPKLLPALKKGDDVTLRAVSRIFEDEGLRIVAPHHFLETLLAPSGVLGQYKPTEDDKSDADRADAIVSALGSVDVGQGAVVAQGICLACESIQGTDAMLHFVAQTAQAFKPDPSGSRGLLLKAPKTGQDWRVDLPTIGPQTVKLAAQAGLGGIVVQAGGVLVLGLEETVRAADEAGIFLWARPEELGFS